MRSIPAREIKRRGISAADEALAEGPVYIIRNDRPSYVVLTQDQYKELADVYEEAALERVRQSLKDVEAGRVKRSTAQEIIEEFRLRS